jgi:chemotaxis signal transduction protein
MAEEMKVVGQAVKKIADREGKYLTFTLEQEEYGIGIRKVIAKTLEHHL